MMPDGTDGWIEVSGTTYLSGGSAGSNTASDTVVASPAGLSVDGDESSQAPGLQDTPWQQAYGHARDLYNVLIHGFASTKVADLGGRACGLLFSGFMAYHAFTFFGSYTLFYYWRAVNIIGFISVIGNSLVENDTIAGKLSSAVSDAKDKVEVMEQGYKGESDSQYAADNSNKTNDFYLFLFAPSVIMYELLNISYKAGEVIGAIVSKPCSAAVVGVIDAAKQFIRTNFGQDRGSGSEVNV